MGSREDRDGARTAPVVLRLLTRSALLAGLAVAGWLCMTGTASALDVAPPPVVQSAVGIVEPAATGASATVQSPAAPATEPVTTVASTVTASVPASPPAVAAAAVGESTSPKSRVEQASDPVRETGVKSVTEAPQTVEATLATTTKTVEDVAETVAAVGTDAAPVVTDVVSDSLAAAPIPGTPHVAPGVTSTVVLPHLLNETTAPLADLIPPVQQVVADTGAALPDAQEGSSGGLGFDAATGSSATLRFFDDEVAVLGSAIGASAAAATGAGASASPALDAYGSVVARLAPPSASATTLHGDARPSSPDPLPSAPAAPFGVGLAGAVATALSASTYAGALAGFLGLLIVFGLSGSGLLRASALRIRSPHGVKPSVPPA